MPSDYILTKGKYCKGLQCLKLLYAEESMEEEVDLALELKFRQGKEVLEAARKQFPDGVLIERDPWGTVLGRTQKRIDDKTPMIFEATFCHDEVLMRVDVLRRAGEKVFDIIEVKSGTSVKEVHIPDVAVQRYVLEGAGFGVNKTFIMHLNSDYVHPDSGNLFEIEDVTDDVLVHLPDVGGHVKAQKEALGGFKPPEIEIGPQCSGPYDCILEDECWSKIPEISIFNIPRLRWAKKWDLFGNKIIFLGDLPEGYSLNIRQKRFVHSALNNIPIIDDKNIKRELNTLKEPIYFMDFETMNWAIPRYSQSSPYNQIPFQWSLHILSGGNLEHREFLAEGLDDSRPGFVRSLIESVGDSGPIVVYHKSFEGGILKNLAGVFPDRQQKLHNIVGRLWDLEKIFLKFYTDSKFFGSTSIKNVLPVVAPELSYDGLEINDGGLAQAGYVKMIESEGEEKERLRNALLEYCKMDTMAMVGIYGRLREIVEG